MENQQVELPWSEVISAEQMDSMFFYAHSGGKIISPYTEHLLGNDSEISELNKNYLALMIWSRYGVKWSKLYATITAEYDPTANYDITETEKIPKMQTTRTPAQTTVTTTPAETTETSTPAKMKTERDVENDIYGFNSSSEVPANKVGETVTTESLEDSVLKYTSDTAGTEKLEVDADEVKLEEALTDRILTRKGNIGVATTQNLISQERKLWQWDFYQEVFKDCATFLTINAY